VDRIDIHVDVPAVPFAELSSHRNSTSSTSMREQVLRARRRQSERFAGLNLLANTRMNSKQIRQFCRLDETGQNLLKQAVYELGLSARAHDKVLKIARTIADLEETEEIQPHHIAEEIQYRRLDRNL